MKPSRERDNYAYIKGILEREFSRSLRPFFQGTVTEVAGSGPYSVQVRRTGETTSDGNTYLCASPGYVPAVGDTVECVWRDNHTGYVLLPLTSISTGTTTAAPTWRGSAKPRVLVASGILSGPLPLSQTFQPAYPDSAVLIQVSGTLYTGFVGIGYVVVNLDGVQVATSSLYFNTASVHQTLPTVPVTVTNLSVASHTVQIAIGNGSSDANTRYSILVEEFPA